MCIVLYLACYLFTYLRLLKKNDALFQGTSQYNMYAKIFLGIINENKVDPQMLGVEYGDLGTHLCRKGIVTMVATG